MKLSVIIDNTAHDRALAKEWGLAMAIETDEGMFLWDTGGSDELLNNAREMGIDLEQAGSVSLSHGHYDHTGGLESLMTGTAFSGEIIAHPRAFVDRYSVSSGESRAIGTRYTPETFTSSGPVHELSQTLTLLTSIPRQPGLFQPVQGFYFDTKGTKPDIIEDDAFIVAKTESGPVAILGCCHSGLGNSLLQAQSILGIDEFYAVVGGLHLYRATDDEIRETADFLDKFKVKHTFAGHCTGDEPLRKLAGFTNANVQPMGSGLMLGF